jgi:hypothetical protein
MARRRAYGDGEDLAGGNKKNGKVKPAYKGDEIMDEPKKFDILYVSKLEDKISQQEKLIDQLAECPECKGINSEQCICGNSGTLLGAYYTLKGRVGRTFGKIALSSTKSTIKESLTVQPCETCGGSGKEEFERTNGRMFKKPCSKCKGGKADMKRYSLIYKEKAVDCYMGEHPYGNYLEFSDVISLIENMRDVWLRKCNHKVTADEILSAIQKGEK